MANKKIIVLKFRELIYTGIFLFFGIILILLLVTMFRGKPSEERENASPTLATNTTISNTHNLFPGLYTTDLTMAGNAFTLELRVQQDLSTDLRLVPSHPLTEEITGDEYIQTMFPLVESALKTLHTNLAEGAPLSEITFSLENQYTGNLLRDALEQVLARTNTSVE